MAHVREAGPCYWHTMNVPARGPLVTADFTYEVDHPYRVGRALILRLPGTGRCLVIGYWFARLDEDDALLASAGGRPIPLREALRAA